jgi:outer membrane protein
MRAKLPAGRLEVVFFSLFLVVALCAAAPKGLAAEELGLDECIARALENNYGLKAVREQRSAAEQGVTMARADLLPALNVSGSYSLQDRPDIFVFEPDVLAPGIPPEEVDISAENKETYEATVSIVQPLFTGGRLLSSYQKSKRLSEQSAYRMGREKTVVIFDVTKAFYQAIKEKTYIRTLGKAIRAKKERLRVLRERYREGYVLQDAVLDVENDLSAAELELFKTQNSRDLALSRLKMLLGWPDDEPLSVRGGPANMTVRASLDEVKQSALNNRADLKAAQAHLRSMSEDVDIAKSQYYPSISLEGSYTTQKETNVTRPEVWKVTGNLEWTVFQWNRTTAAVRRARSLRNEQLHRYEQMKRDVLLEAESAWRALRERIREVQHLEHATKIAETQYSLAETRYSERTIQLADLLEREAALIQAYNDYLISVMNLDIDLAHLEAVTSSSAEAWITKEEPYEPEEWPTEEHSARPTGKRDGAALKNGALSGRTIGIQFGAFKSPDRARALKERLLKTLDAKEVTILAQNGFFKVRAMGFAGKREALETLSATGLKGLIIVNR